MIFRHVLAALAITGLATTASAQTTPATPDKAPSVSLPPTPGVHGADARMLIGRNVKNGEGDTIGEIKSVFITSAGMVDSVMVGVGGFLGVGDREVQLAWKDLQISENGEKVTANLSKDQLKAMAPYDYKDTAWRGNVFSERGLWTDDQRAARDARATTEANRDRAMVDSKTMPDGKGMADRKPGTTAPSTTASGAASTAPGTMATESTGDFNAAGEVSANALIGTKIKNENKDTVGTVEDLYIDSQGTTRAVVVSVGGFLSVGAKDVAMKWSDLRQSRDGKSLVLTTNLSKDDLKTLPDYISERRRPATPEQATVPKTAAPR